MPETATAPHSIKLTQRDAEPMLETTLAQWQAQCADHNSQASQGGSDLWVFGYGSLIWRPEFEFTERRPARVHGWHRALHMWSTLNRGSPECPGLVLALLLGGSCQGVVFRISSSHARQALSDLWHREMPGGVYEPRWLRCATPEGAVNALAFTLPRSSPSYCGALSAAQYRHIFKHACGRYGTTLDYTQRTYESLLAEGIDDKALAALLKLS